MTDAHDELYAKAKAAIKRNEDPQRVAGMAIRAAAVIALIDEVRRLKAERDVWVHNSDQSAECWRNLRAENERMRKALEMIAGKESGMGVHRACCAKGKSIADTALAGERGKA